MKKKALITGINGQDGSYLAEILLAEGYEVYGVMRRSSMENREKTKNIRHIWDKLRITSCSLENALSVYKLLAEVRPQEIYHLAAASFVSYAPEDDLSVMTSNFNTTYNILLNVWELCPKCRVYFAGTSEIFGRATESPQRITTHYNPRSMYGISKLTGHCLVQNYRNRYGLFACTGFAYNHESPRRGRSFVTRKITAGVAAIAKGKQKFIEMGNMDAVRDWGYAPEYVDAMHRMLLADSPKDYIIATGVLHTVRDVLVAAFSKVGLDYRDYVRVNPEFIRPEDGLPLRGDASAIYEDLGWRATKPLSDIIEEMVEHDMAALTE